jgi:lycopene beta-cyclase
VTSERFDRVVRAAIEERPGFDVLLGAEAVDIGANYVRLANGDIVYATVVVDARGPDRASVDAATTGYQKFVGLEVRVPDHGLERPLLMDACVEQRDGFRFVYVLPFGPDHLLIEDTRFSDGPELDVDALVGEVDDYAFERGYEIVETLRIEKGVLPLTWQSDIDLGDDHGPLVAGYQGGWFHPVTGYSFPVVLRLAMHIARTEPGEARGEGLRALAEQQRRQLAFCDRLNRMLFNWFAPEKRRNVLERFYTLPEPLIRRFYAMQLTRMDRARILVGRPPRGMSYRAALFGRSPA